MRERHELAIIVWEETTDAGFWSANEFLSKVSALSTLINEVPDEFRHLVKVTVYESDKGPCSLMAFYNRLETPDEA